MRSLVARGLRPWGEAGHQRRSSGFEGRHRGGPGRGLVAALQGAFHEERPLFGPEGGPADGRWHHPHRLCQPDAESAREQWRRVSEGFRHRFPRLAELMEESEEDVLSSSAFPQEHWQKIWSNSPL